MCQSYLQVYDARVVQGLKDLYLFQHIGGAVAAVEGGDDVADDLVGNPVQVWHPEAKHELLAGPLFQHLAHRVLGGQLGRVALRGGLQRHEYKHLII